MILDAYLNPIEPGSVVTYRASPGGSYYESAVVVTMETNNDGVMAKLKPFMYRHPDQSFYRGDYHRDRPVCGYCNSGPSSFFRGDDMRGKAVIHPSLLPVSAIILSAVLRIDRPHIKLNTLIMDDGRFAFDEQNPDSDQDDPYIKKLTKAYAPLIAELLEAHKQWK